MTYKMLETLVNTAFVDIENICSSVRERRVSRTLSIVHKWTRATGSG